MKTAKLVPALIALCLAAAALVEGVAMAAEPLAKTLFGAQKLPAATPAKSYGFYSKGCFSGGVAIGVDGANWQAMRLSRNRRWGHPKMIEVIERCRAKPPLTAGTDSWWVTYRSRAAAPCCRVTHRTR